jgi:hypothetical protein
MLVVVAGCASGPGARTTRLTTELALADGCGAPLALTEVDVAIPDLATAVYRAQACGRVVYYECLWRGKNEHHECCYPAPAPPAVDLFRFDRSGGACSDDRPGS